MKFIFWIFFFLTISHSFSQNEISYEKTLNEIEISSNVLVTNLIIPNNDFSIGIFTEGWDVEDLTFEQCGDIKTDSIKNSKIIDILKSKGLLDKLYLFLESNEYVSIESSEKFDFNEQVLVIILYFTDTVKRIDQVYIPIDNKRVAKELIKSLQEIFNSDYCFKRLKRNL